ncbi:MAG: hypothetical protein K1X91_10110 [Bacteriodetes bacterium]|nr:hypothetical protein [Bacteroidota bacterium]
MATVVCSNGDNLTRSLFEMNAEKNTQIVLRSTANLLTLAGTAQFAAQRIINMLHAEGHEVVITYDANNMMQITTKQVGKVVDE